MRRVGPWRVGGGRLRGGAGGRAQPRGLGTEGRGVWGQRSGPPGGVGLRGPGRRSRRHVGVRWGDGEPKGTPGSSCCCGGVTCLGAKGGSPVVSMVSPSTLAPCPGVGDSV